LNAALVNLIGDLGRAMGAPSLAPNDDGICLLDVHGRTEVALRCGDNDDELWFFVDVGVPAAGPEMYLYLLRANLFWRGTQGGTISLSTDDPPHAVIAHRLFWRGRNAASLVEELGVFVGMVEEWSKLILLHRDQWGQIEIGTLGEAAPFATVFV